MINFDSYEELKKQSDVCVFISYPNVNCLRHIQ